MSTRGASVALALGLAAAMAGAQEGRGPLEAYVSWPSVRAGGSLPLHVSSREEGYDIEVRRQGESEPRWTRRGLVGQEGAVPAGAPGVDCGWPPDCELPIGADWPSGTWWARLSSSNASCEVPFVVRPAAPAARILSLMPACTVAAYETWGGACLYPTAVGPPVPVVTLRRPHDPAGLRRHGDPALEAWLAARGFAADHAADVDLEREPDLLDGYDLLLLAGHHEYWSAGMRASVDAFVGNGGRVLVLGANTCYWQIRLEQDGTALRCHKRPERDALFASGAEDRRLVTSTFLGEPVLDAQERTLGLSWQHASWTAPLEAGLDRMSWPIGAAPAGFPSTDGFGCWRVAAPDQPDLAGLMLECGDLLGAAELQGEAGSLPVGLCGGEVDGALIEEIDGARPASSALGAPRNLLVLADAPAQEGFAALAAFERGGEVLWCSSERFTRGLTEPRLAADDLSSLVASALRRLSRPRRNLLANGGFVAWDGGTPRGWSVTGEVRRAGPRHAAAGRGAVEVPSGSGAALSQSLPRLSGDSGHLLLGIASTPSAGAVLRLLDGGGTARAATRRVSADGLVHAAFAPPAGTDGAATVQAAGDGLLLDQVELLDEGALGAEALPLAPAADGLRLLAAPTPGGGLHLVLVGEPRAAELLLLDADDGRRLGRVAQARGQTGPLLLAAGDGARGRMARLALAVRAADGRPLLPADALVLPLRLPAPAPAPRLDDGGFERADGRGRPLHWSVEGAVVASVVPEARLTGASGLRVEASRGGGRLVQSLAVPVADEPVVLSAFVRGAGELALSLERDGAAFARCTATAGAGWSAVRLPSVAPQETGELTVTLHVAAGARLDLDTLSLRTAHELLVDDLYPNGAFEIAPSPAEIARGADWTLRPPRWAAVSGPPPAIDDEHALGRHALRLAAGAKAVTRLGWAAAWDRPALVGAQVLAGGEEPVTLRLLVGAAGAPAPPEVARWTGTTSGEGEDALLAVASSATAGTPPEAWLMVEAGKGGAWLDNVTFVVEE